MDHGVRAIPPFFKHVNVNKLWQKRFCYQVWNFKIPKHDLYPSNCDVLGCLNALKIVFLRFSTA